MSAATLFKDAVEEVLIEQWEPGAEVSLQHSGGMEVLVIEGNYKIAEDEFSSRSWLRLPKKDQVTAVAGPEGSRVWIKKGHLTKITVPS